MPRFIVVNNNNFEVLISTTEPASYALKEPNGTTWGNQYLLINTMVKVSWKDIYNYEGNHCLIIEYKKTNLLKLNGMRNIQVVIDALNKYKSITKEDLEAEYQNAGNLEKSDLEVEIQNLRDEKKQIIEEAKVYTKILEKGKELLGLIKSLEG